MIALSRPFTLRHPWWSVVFLTLLGVLFILLALLPLWGWVELRFSPVRGSTCPFTCSPPSVCCRDPDRRM